jgi:hypothetical protein
MVLSLGFFRAILMRVEQRRMIVLVHVIVRPVSEFAHRTAGVLVRDVPVVVRMHLSGMLVLVGFVAHDLLLGLDRHASPPIGSLKSRTQHSSCATDGRLPVIRGVTALALPGRSLTVRSTDRVR